MNKYNKKYKDDKTYDMVEKKEIKESEIRKHDVGGQFKN